MIALYYYILPLIALTHQGSAKQIASVAIDMKEHDSSTYEPLEHLILAKDMDEQARHPVDDWSPFDEDANELFQERTDEVIEDHPAELNNGLQDPIEDPRYEYQAKDFMVPRTASSEPFTDESFAALQRSLDQNNEANEKSRIVGGATAPKGCCSFLVSVITATTGHDCAGSILSPFWVLTAAHCTYNRVPHDLGVVAGSEFLSDDGGEVYRCSGIINHEKWDPDTFTNDISLMWIYGPIQMNDRVRPVVLPTADNTYDGMASVLYGWGKTSFPGHFSNEIQKVELPLYNIAQCRMDLSQQDNKKGPVINVSQICTFSRYGQGACHGDSGGPLLDLNHVQIGIVSWGIQCARGHPDVFTRVFSYRDWIYTHSGL